MTATAKISKTTFNIVVVNEQPVEFVGTLAEAKKAIQAALVQYGNGDYIRTQYASAMVDFEDKRAFCTLTPKLRLRMDVRDNAPTQAAKPVYGKFVKVVAVVGKYCESMGSYEVLTVEDVQGQQFSVSNMYDAGACFRNMDEAQKLQYATDNV